ncbi:hypothetical protein [Paracoccus ravus]|uniref:hypothetical protein n=1 Tax=Paracoccus ravus TaxID=2447760 RepID=UPI00106EF4EA|nr:hypothetical protein [Paracoccus ravus]
MEIFFDGPGAGTRRSAPRLVFISKEQSDIPGPRLLFHQLQPQSGAVDRLRVLPFLQPVVLHFMDRSHF